MSLLRRICLYICGSAFRFVLFFGVTIVCFSLVFVNPSSLKQTLRDSGIYDSLTEAVVEDTAKQNPTSTIPLDDPQIKQIIKASFTPASLQRGAETVIDGTFSWLEGETKTPVFNVDFSGERKIMSDNIASYAFGKLAQKPACFAIPETIDPFTAGCIPPYTDLGAQQQNLSDQLTGPSGLLPDATFTANDLPKDSSGNPIYERYSFAPSVYSWLRYSPWIALITLIGLATGMVLLSSSKRRGFQSLSIAIISSGVALIITPIIFSYVLPQLSSSLSFNSSDKTPETQLLINDVSNQLTTNFYTLIINVTIQVIAVGFVILIAEKLTRPRTKYSNVAKRAGVVNGNSKRPSSGKKYKSTTIPIQSSEESARRKPRRTKNRKYRTIPKKEI